MDKPKQVITIAISCDKTCPPDKPDCCLECKNMKKIKDKIEIVEVLDDTRDEDEEAPPRVNNIGDDIEDDEE